MALTGNETLFVDGVTPTGMPAGRLEQCTAQDIANLSGGGNSRLAFNVTTNTNMGSAPYFNYIYFANGTLTLTLPAAAGNTSRYSVANIGTGVVTIAGTIDGQTNYVMAQQYQTADFMSNQTSWNVF